MPVATKPIYQTWFFVLFFKAHTPCTAGAWAQKIQHPSSGLTKEYVVLTEPAPSQRHLQKIAAGCTVDGVFVQPVAAVLDDSDRTKLNRVRVVVAEGRKHEVRSSRLGICWACRTAAC